MKATYEGNKLLLGFIILFSIFAPSFCSLSFTYPQSTTLGNYNILIVEKNGIYICNQNYTSILKTVYTFSDEDKIVNEECLSKTIIKKSSYVILIFTSYKLYILDTSNGGLLYHNDTKLIIDENPDYITLAYSYNGETNKIFYFIIGYINSNNYLKLKYYQFFNSDSGSYITYYKTASVNSVTRTYDNNSYTFMFQNKGLSCDRIVDYYNSKYSWITCFLIGKLSVNEYLIPVNFEISNSNIEFTNNYYSFDYIKINNVNQIKSETNGGMTLAYVCYATTENVGACRRFYFDKSYGECYFDTQYNFTQNCRPDNYGIKVAYIFGVGDIILSCSNLDGSLQAYSISGNKIYTKFEGCTEIYGYSIIYLNYKDDYYVTSDVQCPGYTVPYTLLKNENDDEYSISVESSVLESPTIYTDEVSNANTDNTKEDSTVLTDNTKENNTILTDNMKEDSTVLTDNTKEERTISTDNTKEDSTFLADNAKEDSTVLNNNSKEDSSVLTDNTKEDSTVLTDKRTEGISDSKEEVIDCPDMCLECNTEKKCIKCNKNKGYYPIELSSSSSETIICKNETTKDKENPDFYFDIVSETFKACYEKCAACFGKGDGNNHNCKTCASGYIFHPEYENSTECVPKPNPYYYIEYGIYTTTNSKLCPNNFNYLIEEKKKCIEECEKDSTYKYTYNDICYDECPENTYNNVGEYKCKDIPDKCIYTKKKLYTLNEKITNNEIQNITSKYAKEYEYTNNHISLYENEIYIINIYKNGQCLTNFGLSTKTIDFGACYDKVYDKLSETYVINTNLIIVNIKTKPGKEDFDIKPSYGLYNPITGSAINLEEECKDDKITIENNFTEEFNNSKVSLDTISKMAGQGIDLFDIYNPFYTDLCTHYPDILGKDIPLKKRILAYYPNIDLCDDNCNLLGVFMNNKTAKCECSLSGEGDKKNSIKDNALYQSQAGQFEEMIDVIKCYKGVFEYKYFKISYGGFIIMGLIIIQIICTVFYYKKSKIHIKKYIFSITNCYFDYLKNKKPTLKIEQQDFKLINIKENNKANVSLPPRRINKAPTGFGMTIN